MKTILRALSPTNWASLASLEDLRLHSNNLSDPIPPELGDLANLRHLYLYANQLTGEIPPELGNLANLRVLAAHRQQTLRPDPVRNSATSPTW